MEWINIINEVVPYTMGGARNGVKLTGDEESFYDVGLDSLDVAALSVYLCEVLAVPPSVERNGDLGNVAEMIAFLDKHAVRRDLTVPQIRALLD
ncbi:acyl carrier protein [Herbaspirillum seropedicae]|uniref:phosphopantetheine-binding protein n=1 Tax=Herbaspirillum seropedicae TaxID=964 RepID=UPI001124BDEC|nr:phosphopantetheine-binding protein [Herbaspirillum seropedicae]QDD64254.1 acyl carrier protein [Herbaspirillum seropedicae]